MKTVRDMLDEGPDGRIGADALAVDPEGRVWVDLGAPVHAEAEAGYHPIRIRRNHELIYRSGEFTSSTGGIGVGEASLIEVPAEDLERHAPRAVSAPPSPDWARVTFWRPWSRY